MDESGLRVELKPADLPDLDGLRTDEDFRREAERIAPGAHRRAAYDLAVVAWRDATASLRVRRVRPHYGEGQRAAYIERFVDKSLADESARAAVAARVEALLRELKAGPAPGP